VADAGQDVLQRPPGGSVIEHLLRGDRKNPETGRLGAQGGLGRHLARLPVAGDHGVEPVVECLLQLRRPAAAGPEREQAGSVGVHLFPGDPALAFRAAPPPFREQAAEVAVAVVVLREQQDALVVHRHLRAVDQVYAQLAGADVRAHDAVDAVAVGEREALEAEPVRALHELAGMARALEKGEVALAPERHVGGGHSTRPWRYQRRRRLSQ
jgi:hypothetical protein